MRLERTVNFWSSCDCMKLRHAAAPGQGALSKSFWGLCLVLLVLNVVFDYFHPGAILIDVILIPLVLWRCGIPARSAK